MIRINDNPTTRELRQFAGIWFPVFWLVVACLLYFGAEASYGAWAAAGVGLTIGAIGVWRPSFVLPIYLIWMYAAYPVGFIVSHLLLATIFYGVVTPIGVLARMLGYDPLARQFSRGAASYWIPVPPVTDKTQYLRQF